MTTEQATPKRRWRPRFSLLTLVLGVLFVGACGGLWWRWEPWACVLSLPHKDQVTGVGFAPDGSSFWTCELGPGYININNLIHVWDGRTGRERFVKVTPRGGSGAWGGGVSYSQDSCWIRVGEFEAEREVVFNAETGDEVDFGKDGTSELPQQAFSNDGQRLIYATGHDVRVRDLVLGTERICELPADHTVQRIHYAPAGRRIAVFCERYEEVPAPEPEETSRIAQVEHAEVRLFDDVTGWRVPLELQEAFSPEGCNLAMSGKHLAIAFRNPDESGKRSIVICDPITGRSRCVIDNAEGRYHFCLQDCILAVVDNERKVTRLFDVSTGKERATLQGEPHWPGAYSARFLVMDACVDPNPFLPGDERWDVYVWDAEQGHRTIELQRSNARFWGGWFTKDELRVVSQSCIWDAKTGRHVIDAGRILWPSHDERICVAIDRDQPTTLVESMSGATLYTFTEPPATGAAFSPDDQTLLSRHVDDVVRLWSRRRPEYEWGIVVLPELWIAVLSGGALLVIAARRLRARKVVKQEAA